MEATEFYCTFVLRFLRQVWVAFIMDRQTRVKTKNDILLEIEKTKWITSLRRITYEDEILKITLLVFTSMKWNKIPISWVKWYLRRCWSKNKNRPKLFDLEELNFKFCPKNETARLWEIYLNISNYTVLLLPLINWLYYEFDKTVLINSVKILYISRTERHVLKCIKIICFSWPCGRLNESRIPEYSCCV